MDHYLVMLRCGCDDLPIRIFLTYVEAYKFAQALKPEDAVVEEAIKTIEIGVSFFCNVSIYCFKYTPKGETLQEVRIAKEFIS